MRYLVLSDIHGNHIALSAVLDRVPAHRYDAILALGDYVGDGPCPDKVLDMLIERNAVMIAGNREDLANAHRNGFAETQTALQWKFMRDSLACLTQEHWALLAGLPEQKTVQAGGLSVRMAHGSPLSVRELLSRHNPDRLQECLNSISEPILLCGHNHDQFAYEHENRLVLNPGSVGLSQKGDPFRADYALLNLSGNQYSFELNHVYYDGGAIQKAYEERDLWHTNLWGQIAYREMAEGKKYIVSFARFVHKLAREANAPIHPIDDFIWKKASETWNWKPVD